MRKKIFIIVLTLSFTLILGLSYGTFIVNTDKYSASELLISNLLYNIEIKTTGGTEIINGKTVTTTDLSTVLVTITSLNPIDSNYSLEYKITKGSGKVYYADNTGWMPSGKISKDGGLVYVKTIKVVIEANLTVEFNVSGGYTYNEGILALTGYTPVTEKYNKIVAITEGEDLVNIVEEETNCTSNQCLYGGESKNNYLQYPTANNTTENMWRILGLYNLDNEKIVKIISDIKSTSTVENIQTSLTTFYGTLNKANDYILPTNKFNCTETICSESTYTNIGLLTTNEYNKIGGYSSYLANSNNFFTSSGNIIENITPSGVEQTSASTSSNLRPVIYLQSDVKVTGSGTSNNPYRLVSKGDIILASATLNGTPMSSFPSENDPYVVNKVECTNGTTGYWDEEKRTIILTNPNLPTTCTVDFKTGYTVTMKGEGATISSANSVSVGRVGETSFTFSTKPGYDQNSISVSCDGGATPSINGSTVKVTNIKSSQICTVRLEQIPTLASTLKKAYPSSGERTDFTNVYTETKMHTATDYDGNTTYYFTGNPNNWVSFAGKLWRVIRINGDGSVRLLYAGSGGEDGYLGLSQFNVDKNSPAYVGWKYTLGSPDSLTTARQNTTPSIIYTYIKTNWFDLLTTEQKSYINFDAIYCNDRNTNYNDFSSDVYFPMFYRIKNSENPNYSCEIGDRFKDGFGLMTLDEVLFGGAGYNATDNSTSYYSLNKDGGKFINSATYHWFSMSPNGCVSSLCYIFSFSTRNIGKPVNSFSNNAGLVRPVTSLKSCVQVKSGDGTGANPYIINIDSACSTSSN